MNPPQPFNVLFRRVGAELMPLSNNGVKLVDHRLLSVKLTLAVGGLKNDVAPEGKLLFELNPEGREFLGKDPAEDFHRVIESMPIPVEVSNRAAMATASTASFPQARAARA